MLYLRTGANGACKSLFTLKDVREKQLKELRPVCVIIGDAQDPNRQYVKIKPEKMQEFGWTTCTFDKWWDQPDGTIFLADECHNYLPKRANGSAVPQQVSRLAEHRARGFDFFLLTQHPSNIDSFVTKLIGAPGWHQHLKRAAGGSNVTSVIQWDAVNLQCEKNGSGKSGQVDMRPQPKDVYEWYDSAELHTGKTRIPKAAIYLAVCVLLVPLLLGTAGWFLWSRTVGKAPPAAAAVSTPGGAPVANAMTKPDRPMTAGEYVAAYRPRVAGLLHTAPIYDKLTEPKRVPVPAACVAMASKGCKCFTQDATPYPVSESVCMEFVKHGSFLAFQAEGEAKPGVMGQPGWESAPASDPGPRLVLLDGPGARDPLGAPIKR